MVGLSLDDYWRLPPVKVHKYIVAYQNKIKDEMKIQDRLNYILGKYIAFAVNKPSKYPQKPYLDKEEKEQKDMTPEEMEKRARINTITVGGKIQK